MGEEERMVNGDGWISDDSDWDEDVRTQLSGFSDSYKPKKYWTNHKTDVNDIIASSRAMPLPPQQELFNPGQGRNDSWQSNESAQDFVRRVPPLTTPNTSCEWIWVHNPHAQACSASNAAEFVSRGHAFLQQSLEMRSSTQARADTTGTSKTVTSQMLNHESQLLQQRITDLAAETNILTGKWMLFPELPDLSRIWRLVVDGVINNRLGPTAKVAPDDGTNRARLICIYTRDFRDKEDVLRVLQELVSMGVTGSTGKSIYYKSDPYTYLDIYRETAAKYGLQASLYSSHKMLSEASLSKTAATPQKKQSTLRGFYTIHDAMALD